MATTIPFSAVLRRSRLAVFFIGTVTVLLGVLLYWIIDSRYNDFLHNEQSLAAQSLAATANEINLYIAHRRHLTDIFVSTHSSIIADLAQRPSDLSATLSLSRALKSFFPEAFNFTIANASGDPLLEDREGFVGKGCRADIRSFSRGRHLNEIFIHSNPNPGNYHIDILSRIDDLGNGQSGIFFVSMLSSRLQALLANGAPQAHKFYLLRKDKFPLIELTAEGTRAELAREETLSAGELSLEIDRAPVPGTRWVLVDILAREERESVENKLWFHSLLVGLVFIVLGLAFLLNQFANERRRLASEAQILELNEGLEARVSERTQELEKSQDELSYQASHDHLTGLLNRREFENQLNALIERAEKTRLESVIMYMDLDQFKLVNDTAGHTVGDALLKDVASLLRSQLRRADILARLGGDEFGILLENCSIERALVIADQLKNVVKDYAIDWDGQSYRVGLSIGMTLVTAHSGTATEILSHVDASCYAAKDAGRDTVQIYTPGDEDLAQRRSQMYWASAAIRAIDAGRLVLYCQKIEPLADDTARPWLEVLVRLTSEEDELIFPDTFIPALEHYGGIDKLDIEVIRGAIRFLALAPTARLNINVSGYSIAQDHFTNRIIDIIEQRGVDPSRLVFEITETATVTNLAGARSFINRIRRLGCQIALDDFGSGMSSFGVLKSLDVDYIKLDGAFVKDIDIDLEHRAMVEAVYSVASVLKKKVIAEFVENREISTILESIGVEYGQGYYYHRPAPLTQEGLDTSLGKNVVRFERRS